MRTFDDRIEPPEPWWQTVLGCLLLALVFALALIAI
jgi:hypothetical protein